MSAVRKNKGLRGSTDKSRRDLIEGCEGRGNQGQGQSGKRVLPQGGSGTAPPQQNKPKPKS